MIFTSMKLNKIIKGVCIYTHTQKKKKEEEEERKKQSKWEIEGLTWILQDFGLGRWEEPSQQCTKGKGTWWVQFYNSREIFTEIVQNPQHMVIMKSIFHLYFL